jgi:hypothetical protein
MSFIEGVKVYYRIAPIFAPLIITGQLFAIIAEA